MRHIKSVSIVVKNPQYNTSVVRVYGPSDSNYDKSLK